MMPRPFSIFTTRSLTSFSERSLRCSRRGKATLSRMLSESSSAAYWNTIPNFCRIVFIS